MEFVFHARIGELIHAIHFKNKMSEYDRTSKEEEEYRLTDEARKRAEAKPIIIDKEEDEKELARLRGRMREKPNYHICNNCEGIIIHSCCELHNLLGNVNGLCNFCFTDHACNRCGVCPSAKSKIVNGLCYQCSVERSDIRRLMRDAEGFEPTKNALYT
jgi:hypothetical protein